MVLIKIRDKRQIHEFKANIQIQKPMDIENFYIPKMFRFKRP